MSGPQKGSVELVRHRPSHMLDQDDGAKKGGADQEAMSVVAVRLAPWRTQLPVERRAHVGKLRALGHAAGVFHVDDAAAVPEQIRGRSGRCGKRPSARLAGCAGALRTQW